MYKWSKSQWLPESGNEWLRLLTTAVDSTEWNALNQSCNWHVWSLLLHINFLHSVSIRTMRPHIAAAVVTQPRTAAKIRFLWPSHLRTLAWRWCQSYCNNWLHIYMFSRLFSLFFIFNHHRVWTYDMERQLGRWLSVESWSRIAPSISPSTNLRVSWIGHL